jgi:glucosyl-3-phosphoglycerate synthase
MISVIIPVLNESETITSVIEFAWAAPQVSEVLVIDDGSIDGTPELARAAGATVLTSTFLGKGASMEDGMRAAANETVLYLDGDLQDLRPDLIGRMVEPILGGRADFVKARFSRRGGRVTTLTARPLLRTFFPELAHLEQPLSGIMAARRSLLERLSFENDYGVDIGLLLDAAACGARLAEVDIGHIEHDSQPLEVLGDMATQVARTILDRAACYGRLRGAQLREITEVERLTQAELAIVSRKVGQAQRLALIDMDGVLLEDRFIVELAQRTNRRAALAQFLDQPQMDPDERTQRIAALFAGVSQDLFVEIARTMPLTPGAIEAVVGLRKRGYRVGIVTDSYFVVSETVRRRVFADFSVANLMKFRRGRATGLIAPAPILAHPEGCPHHVHCKLNVMRHLLEKMALQPEQVLAIGDGDNDVCLLREAGQSVAFRPRTPRVLAAARHVVEESLLDVLDLVTLAAIPS